MAFQRVQVRCAVHGAKRNKPPTTALSPGLLSYVCEIHPRKPTVDGRERLTGPREHAPEAKGLVSRTRDDGLPVR